MTAIKICSWCHHMFFPSVQCIYLNRKMLKLIRISPLHYSRRNKIHACVALHLWIFLCRIGASKARFQLHRTLQPVDGDTPMRMSFQAILHLFTTVSGANWQLFHTSRLFGSDSGSNSQKLQILQMQPVLIRHRALQRRWSMLCNLHVKIDWKMRKEPN